MKVVCVDVGHTPNLLTLNKIYYCFLDYEAYNKTYYLIIDDNGEKFGYYSEHFNLISDIREDKINKIFDGKTA